MEFPLGQVGNWAVLCQWSVYGQWSNRMITI